MSKLEKVMIDLKNRGASVKIVAQDKCFYVSAIWNTGRKWLVKVK